MALWTTSFLRRMMSKSFVQTISVRKGCCLMTKRTVSLDEFMRSLFGHWFGYFFIAAIFIASGGRPAIAGETSDLLPAVSQTKKMKWFDEARFGMFIHWGIYSVPAGEWNGQNWYGEWFQLETKMPAAQYAQFAGQFDPVKFDAKAWVKTAKDAGMKYIVITAKHHDGFCMFNTKLTDYNVVLATPWHHDPMKDLAVACHKAGIKLDFYYSIPDWHNPDFPAQYSQNK